jgi:hypothetical protein
LPSKCEALSSNSSTVKKKKANGKPVTWLSNKQSRQPSPHSDDFCAPALGRSKHASNVW